MNPGRSSEIPARQVPMPPNLHEPKDSPSGVLHLGALKALDRGMFDALSRVDSLGIEHPDTLPRYGALKKRLERHVAAVAIDPFRCTGWELTNFANYVVRHERWTKFYSEDAGRKGDFLRSIPDTLELFGFDPKKLRRCFGQIEAETFKKKAARYLYSRVMRTLYRYFRLMGFDHDTLTK